jgi:HK97 family phage portal protein
VALFSFLSKKTKPSISDEDKALLSFIRSLGINTPNNLWEFLIPKEGDSAKNKVTTENALTLSAVYQAINISANSLNLPIVVKQRGKDGSINPVTEKSRYEYQVNFLLHTSPNRMHTPSEWITLMETSRLMYGNGYSYIVRENSGLPKALKWLHPNQVELIPDNIEFYYNVRDFKTGNLIFKNVPSWDMIHVKALNGVSVIDYACKSLEVGRAIQKTSTKFFDDGMTNKVILSYPGSLKGIAKTNLEESFKKAMQEKSQIVLEEGLKPFLLTIPPEQAQMLLMSEFTVTDVARWFNLPEHMLNNLKTSTNNNIEFQGLSFTTHNVRPRIRLYEQEFNWKLLYNSPEYFTEFNMNALLRADLMTRFNAYSLAIQNRIMNPNEVRQLESMNPYEGGDNYENPNITPGKTGTNGNSTKTAQKEAIEID